MKLCSVEDCGKQARSRGYCQTHYMRLHRHGTVNAGRPGWYGSKTKHPLYITWNSAKRGGVLCDSWHNDFWLFVSNVSPVPEGRYRLRRADKSLPYSKENCGWFAVDIERSDYQDVREHQQAVKERNNRKAREKHDPVKRREIALRSRHGMTMDEYEQKLQEQRGVCAICETAETQEFKNGVTWPLVVDHCHKTRQSGASKGVRGLLCSACNIGLGKFDDAPELLRKAAAYLEKYRS